MYPPMWKDRNSVSKDIGQYESGYFPALPGVNIAASIDSYIEVVIHWAQIM